MLSWAGIKRSSRNPNCCTRCNTHLEEGRLAEITTVFADLSSFTALTERLGADSAYDVTDAYLRLVAEILTSHGGFIDKYIGDAVMAFFNLPVKRADHAAAAVAAAREIQAKLPELSARLGLELKASIGVASGFVRAGRLGSNDLKDYTAVGAAVNQAARLQSHAGAGGVLVSRAVYEKVQSAYPGATGEIFSLKGFSEPTAAYRLEGVAGPPTTEAPVSRRDALGVGALLMTLLGGGCLGTAVIAPFLLSAGIAGGAGVLALSSRLDASPLRLPLGIGGAVLALVSLLQLARERRWRRDTREKLVCIMPTASEKRRSLFLTTTAVAALVFCGVELFMHYVLRR
jgi:adenylate cyclase